MDFNQTPTQYDTSSPDDVFLDNGLPSSHNGGVHPPYRRSSSVTNSHTPFLRESVTRRISEPPIGLIYTKPETKHKNFTALSVLVVMVVVLAAGAGFLFYRLEIRTNELQRKLSELTAEYEAVVRVSQSVNTGGADENGRCVCSVTTGEEDVIDSDREVHPPSILQCCTQDSERVKSIIKEVVDEAEDGIIAKISAEQNSNRRHTGNERSAAFAHINGNSRNAVLANNKMEGYITNWNLKLVNRLSYRKGVIHIKHAGVYFVYSQIYFYQGPDDSGHQHVNSTQSLDHEPMLHETCLNGHPLMKSAVPFREFTSKYHGGVFKLEKGNKISIRVSSNDYQVNMDPELSFFGVYCLEETSSPTELPTTELHATTKP